MSAPLSLYSQPPAEIGIRLFRSANNAPNLKQPLALMLPLKEAKQEVVFRIVFDARFHLGIKSNTTGMSHFLLLTKKSHGCYSVLYATPFIHYNHCDSRSCIHSRCLQSSRSPRICSPASPQTAFQ